MSRIDTRNRGECGQVLILTVLAMAVLLGMVAMAVDVGLFLQERRSLQNAADAAALAGAAYLPNGVMASDKARDWAVQNGIDGSDGRQIQAVNVGTDRVEVVVVREDAPFIFGRVLGLTSLDIRARAVAQLGSLSGAVGLTPFGVPENAIKYCAYTQIILPSPPPECLTTLHYNVDDVGSNVGDLDFDGKGGGANELNELIKGGNKNPLCSINETPPPGCPTTEPSKPGNTVGQIRDAIEWRLANTTQHCDTVAETVGPDTDGDGTPELRAGCNPWGGAVGPDSDGDGGTCDNINWTDGTHGSCLIIATPVIQPPLPKSSGDATNVAFALFWLKGFDKNRCKGNDCEIDGYFINAEVSVTGLFVTSNPDNTPFVVLRLVE